jgi:hypothetical protein
MHTPNVCVQFVSDSSRGYVLCSDLVWSFNGVNCTEFINSVGVENCQQSWATGMGADNVRVTASVACEVSCGNDGAIRRDCVLPTPPETEPEPEPPAEPEPELATMWLTIGAIVLLALLLLCAGRSHILNALASCRGVTPVPEKGQLPEGSPPDRDGVSTARSHFRGLLCVISRLDLISQRRT